MNHQYTATDIRAARIEHKDGTIWLQFATTVGPVEVMLQMQAATRLVALLATTSPPHLTELPTPPVLEVGSVLPFEMSGSPAVWLSIGPAFGIPLKLTPQSIAAIRTALAHAELLVGPAGAA